MILTIWNEAEKIRHSIALHLLWNNKQTVLEKKLSLIAGNIFVRRSRIPSGVFTCIDFKFTFPHFIQFTNDSLSVPVLLYAYPLSESTRGLSCRMEWLSHVAENNTFFLRATAQSILLVEPQSAGENSLLSEPVILPCCPEAQQVLRHIMEEKISPILLQTYLQEQWKRFTEIFQREQYAGSRFHAIPIQHRGKIRTTALKIVQSPGSTQSIPVLAKAEGISGTYLKMYFRQYFGQRIHEYQIQHRMQYACRLLSETTFPLQEVSILCGYNDSSNFVKAFRNYFGLAPVMAFR